MSIGSIVIAVLIGAWFVYCIVRAFRKKSCCGCGDEGTSHCEACKGGCDGCEHVDVYGINVDAHGNPINWGAEGKPKEQSSSCCCCK